MTIHSASHLDIIDCAACHVRKIGDEAWNTGGAVVDATGPDHEGRLTDHENDYVLRDMEENLCYTWQNGKVIPSSALTTIFYRDVCGTIDINNDGLGGGMDPPLMPDVLQINIDNSWTSMSMDTSGNVDNATIRNRLDTFSLALAPETIKLCAMVVPFKVTHNVSPAIYALGHNCNDCHNAAAGIFNGNYDLQGKDMTLTYTANSTTCALTKVNNGVDPTDFHFNVVTKLGNRAIPRQVFSAANNMPPVPRSYFLYEDDLTISSGGITSVKGTPVTYTTRAGWIAYLNGITPDARVWPDANVTVTGADAGPNAHGYGVGCNVTSAACVTQGYGADNNRTDGCNCTMIWEMYDATIFNSLDFEADDVGDGASYTWNFTDGTGQQTGRTVSHTFNTLGVIKVTLTVVDAWGIADPQMVLINVKRP
jgi:hypothetical protein